MGCRHSVPSPTEEVGVPPSGPNDVEDDAAATLDNLLDVAASGRDCEADGQTLVDAGDPAGSLLYTKLAGTADCGDPMPDGDIPVNPDNLAAIEQWIMEGAAP